MHILTIIMSVYNNEDFLQESISSILGQSFTDFQFIIVNDCSTDGSRGVIEKFAEQDSRILLLDNETNLGLTKSLNRMLALADSKYIARMDGDDIALPERFATQIAFLESNEEISLCGTFVSTFGKRTRLWKYPVSPEEVDAQLLFESAVAHPTFMMRKTIIEAGYSYDENSVACEDYDFLVRISEKFKISNIPLPLLRYRVSGSSISSKARKKVAERDQNHKRIYGRKLALLGVHCTDAELTLHRNICVGRTEGKVDFINAVEKWFDKLSSGEVIDPQELKKQLGKRWFKVCLKSSSLGLKAYRLYRGNSLSMYSGASLRKRIKFLIKCFFKQ